MNPTQKNALSAGPKLEPFYVLLQVDAQSDAKYLSGTADTSMIPNV